MAELILDALDNPRAATAVRCLAAYARIARRSPPVVSPGQLLAPAPAAEREQVRRHLEGHALLSWRQRGPVRQVTLASELGPDWSQVAAKLQRYGHALTGWQPRPELSELTLAVRKGVLLFNHRLFFEVHEVLEAQWIQEVDPERRFLQGLIQIAVAFYHLGNHNLNGALSLLGDGLDKIRPHAPAYLGLALSDFIVGLERCDEELKRLGPQGLGRFQDTHIPSLQHTEA
ncbi:MAG: DUF309 domain-containing protein [Desulfurellaceae bacterium]|nr:DUF309 domain-containing protein [Desulfurellaceae bacterium]